MGPAPVIAPRAASGRRPWSGRRRYRRATSRPEITRGEPQQPCAVATHHVAEGVDPEVESTQPDRRTTRSGHLGPHARLGSPWVLRTGLQPGRYPRGFAVRSSNNVYESALVHTPTRPGALNAWSCASIRFVPSQYTSTWSPWKSTRSSCQARAVTFPLQSASWIRRPFFT